MERIVLRNMRWKLAGKAPPGRECRESNIPIIHPNARFVKIKTPENQNFSKSEGHVIPVE